MRMRTRLLAIALLTACIRFEFGPAIGECEKIAILWIAGSDMVEAVVSGVTAHKNRLAPDLEVEWHKELDDAGEADRVCRYCECRVDGIDNAVGVIAYHGRHEAV